jgi:5S rRNA maturation endonuclease (ribonuclease M5)
VIEFQTVIDILQEYGQLYIKGDRINMRCMLCGDSKKSNRKKRFWASWSPDGTCCINCFNCGYSSTFAELVSRLKCIPLGESIRFVENINFKDVPKLLKKDVEIIEDNPFIEQEYTTFNWILDDCVSIEDTCDGYIQQKYQDKLKQFIHDRLIPDEYNIFIAYKGDYKGRVILPVYFWGDIIYFQGRSIFESDSKYKNPEVDKTGIIMNLEYFDKDKFIIVSEGIIDGMSVENHQGTSVLGGSVNDKFLSVLFGLTDKGVIIVSDNDERGDKERTKIINESYYNKKLFYFIPPEPCKDINDIKKILNVNNVYDYIVDNKMDYFTYLIKRQNCLFT